jgi:uncharacterized membrane protein
MGLDSAIAHFRAELPALGDYWWMGWNAMLAFIPALLAIIFFKRDEQPRRGVRNATYVFELALVLVILPNAPYVATDMVHFLETVRATDSSLWELLGKEFPRYLTFVIFGLLCYSFTTDRLLHALRMRFGITAYWAALITIPLLCSVGVFIGRVLRYNSWDIFTDPHGILHSTRTSLDSVRIVKIITMMWFGLIFVHQFYKIMHDGLRFRLAELQRYRAELRAKKS